MPSRYRQTRKRIYKRRRRLKKRTTKRKKYFKKVRISKKTYNRRRQQLLSVNTVKSICKKVVKGYPETFKIVRPPTYFYNQGNGWAPITELLNTPQGSVSNTYQTPGHYVYTLVNTNDVTQGTAVGQISGDKYLCKAISIKLYLQWNIKPMSLTPKVHWAIVRTLKAGSQPIMNANLWKTNFFSDPEHVFSKNRKVLGMRIIRRGTIYPPRRRGPGSTPVSVVTETGLTAAGSVSQLISQSYLEESANGHAVSPINTFCFSKKHIYIKFNKKCSVYNANTLDSGLTTNTAYMDPIPFRTFLVMYKEIYPISHGNPIEMQNNVSVLTQKTMYYSDV